MNNRDGKSKSIRIAVKLLRQNLSASRREKFDKEMRLGLDHQDVIKLGACNTYTPFEYYGEWRSQSMQEFDSIVIVESI